MIIHVDPQTGSPVFVMDQIMMIESLRDAYNKYGIHGIYYAVLFGWSASPFAMITQPEERHELVCSEVYGKTFYDPITKEEISREKFRSRDQYNSKIMQAAIIMINRLARVPILEDKALYLKLFDENTRQMNVKSGSLATPAQIEAYNKLQTSLIKNRKELTSNLDFAIEREKTTLVKKDSLSSLDNFILDSLPNSPI